MARVGDEWVSKCGRMILRCGDYHEVLADVEVCDAVITDPPYSERTHAGHDSIVSHTTEAGLSVMKTALSYVAWDAGDVAALLARWATGAGWIVAFSDHVLIPDYEASARTTGRYPFAPIPWLCPGGRIRIQGDGPSCWVTHINASRPRTKMFAKWGTLPGGYVFGREPGHIGGKPLGLMTALVRDYSRPGDLIVDPCAGGGTTLLAAAIEGRRAIGAEIDPKTFALAVKRLERGYTPTFGWEAAQ